jgi:hypothetical protein
MRQAIPGVLLGTVLRTTVLATTVLATTVLATAVFLGGALLAPADARASPAPKKPAALLAALLHAKVKSLPHGYLKPVVGPYQVTAAAKKHHALGGVVITGDQGNEAVIYIVFATIADAKADWAHADFKGLQTKSAPSSIPKPNVMANTTSAAKNGATTVDIGLTDVAFRSGNVIIQGATSSVTNPKQGDPAGSVALALFALQHLKSVA